MALNVDWAERSGSVVLRVTGLESDLISQDRDVISVFRSDLLDGASTGTLPPMAGDFETSLDEVLFRPRFGFLPGASYTVFIHHHGDGAPITMSIERPARAHSGAQTRIVQLYPTAACVPVNLLRMYVEFSASMSEGEVRRHVHVIDGQSGQEMADALLTVEPELWDRQRRRLTLLLDPGRIKQGLVPHSEIGYPLAQGREVRIVIDSGFSDSAGRPVQTAFERSYQVGEGLSRHVDPSQWVIQRPAVGTQEPFVVEFDRSLDHGLLQHSVAIRADAGLRIAGRVAVGREERTWAFLPDRPWLTGDYLLEVDHRLEDLAGNSVSRVFDRDLRQRGHDRRDESPAMVAFSIREE